MHNDEATGQRGRGTGFKIDRERQNTKIQKDGERKKETGVCTYIHIYTHIHRYGEWQIGRKKDRDRGREIQS